MTLTRLSKQFPAEFVVSSHHDVHFTIENRHQRVLGFSVGSDQHVFPRRRPSRHFCAPKKNQDVDGRNAKLEASKARKLVGRLHRDSVQ